MQQQEMKKILIIDDDVELCNLVQEFLDVEGFASEAVFDGIDGFNKADSGQFDLVTLDVMLPKLNGIELLKKLRQTSAVPVIMLTARGDEVDRILGLELGADDYLPKPFSPRELVARIRAVFRRTGRCVRAKMVGETRIELADIVLDSATRTVALNQQPLAVTEVEFLVLETLLKNAGEVVDRQDLAMRALGRKLDYFDRSLDVHMSNLRKKLGHYLGECERIKTVRGIGYLYVKPDR
jgi:two-component system response regulator CpxR